MDIELSVEESAKALRDAEAKGLPKGWSVKLDKRRRRKWIAPNGKSCDSIPKAIAISIEIGLLPPDTPIPASGKKRAASKEPPGKPSSKKSASPKSSSSSSSITTKTTSSKSATKSSSKIISTKDKEKIVETKEQDEDNGYQSDPEESLEPFSPNKTVHWDPESQMGRMVGWRIRIWDTKIWRDGRILLYDPYTNKHKVQMNVNLSGLDKNRSVWLRLMHETVQYGTRLVWAHVKGFAWWPAMVMDGDALDGVSQRKGRLIVNFFSTNEVSSLKESPETIRPFCGGKVDTVINKNKKKRNVKAVKMAREEEAMIIKTRNEASRYYATKAFAISNQKGNNLLGRRIQLHRSDVNYPYGDTVVGKVRQYSPTNKKWLLSFEMSEKTKTKYESSWISLASKDCDYKLLDKKKKIKQSESDILPFIRGFQCIPVTNNEDEPKGDELISKLISERCNACVDYLLPKQEKIKCIKCESSFHIGCVDPCISTNKIDLETWVCSRCETCEGCWQRDIVFGSQEHSINKFSATLCSLCVTMFDKQQFCPNCLHIWDDTRYQRVHNRSYTSPFMKGIGGGRGRKRKHPEENDVCEEIEMDSSIPVEASWYYPDTSIWGYTAGNMLGCDECGLWVHSGCSGLSREDYDCISSGKHPIYSKEFLCRTCCQRRCNDLIEALRQEDKMVLFEVPVTEKVAGPTYHEIIKKPMDLQTMSRRAKGEEYQNYAWVREDFELMVLNALTFNRANSKVWNEANRFYHDCLKKVFKLKGKGAPPGIYSNSLLECFSRAEKERKNEEQRTQKDDTTEKKDLVAGATVTKIVLPALRSAPDQPSCLPFKEVRLKPVEAHFCSWMESCFVCGSSGASDTMLFCIDCGESFHAFCVNAPIHSMEISSVSGWRCANCKICEISGEVPQDETKMLFCEMCDRAFTTDLLDPPLPGAPQGLWICGQCVDCKSCNNSSEKNGISLKYWSRDPEKCYRCGGCEGLVEEYTENLTCSVCSEFLRKDDNDIVKCKKCMKYVKAKCDPAAAEYLKRVGTGARSGAGKKFECKSCRMKNIGILKPDLPGGTMLRKQLHSQAWTTVLRGMLSSEPDRSSSELHSQLCTEIDWRIRKMWINEYLSVIEDGFTMIAAIKRRDLNPRSIIQNSSNPTADLPRWISNRSARFLLFAERSMWEKEKISVKNIHSIQILARMAASYLRLNCKMFELDEKIEVRAYNRMLSLLNKPDHCGLVEIPIDPVKVEENENLIQQDIWTFSSDKEGEKANIDQEKNNISNKSPDSVEYIIPKALCGWNEYLNISDKTYEWKDPRICCLCRTSGDDDGDIERDVLDGLELARCGRLLPMKDGLWVHVSCALWSSEVYEAANGAVHCMEKARSRGSQLKCFGCGRAGASVGCYKPNCPRNYHFTCAKACGAIFTTSQQMFCEMHKTSDMIPLPTESVEHMKSLVISDDKKDVSDLVDGKYCLRVGALTVHSLGKIEQKTDGFHTEKYITPPGYIATRIFWSTREVKTRTNYILKVEKDKEGGPLFRITPGDNPSSVISDSSMEAAYKTLIERVKYTNREYFSSGDMYSKLPVERKHSKKIYGLNGPHFFGFGLSNVRKALECLKGVEAVVAPLSDTSPSYRFVFIQPKIESIMDLQRNRAAAAAESALENLSGSARTEGMKAVMKSGGSGRITRALVRNAPEQEDVASGRKRTDAEERKAKADRDSNQHKYKEMKSVPLDDRLAARRSHIHGWGLFCKIDHPKDSMIIEYMGEVVRQCIADKRERGYEKSGIGSCYMFRLDLQRIVDATRIGCMARFMNHCCQPNAYAKVISVDTELGGQEKKICVFANRDITAGEEITYDYKFPVEDGSLKCSCGAPNCIGRLN